MGRPFSGGRHGHVARRAGGDRGAHASGARVFGARASGAGDAVNGKYENKENRDSRYQVVLVDITLDRLMTCTKR